MLNISYLFFHLTIAKNNYFAQQYSIKAYYFLCILYEIILLLRSLKKARKLYPN